MDDVLPEGEELTVRRTANLHTGGTIHDVTSELHPLLAEASVAASWALAIPVTGIDLLATAPDQPEYVIIGPTSVRDWPITNQSPLPSGSWISVSDHSVAAAHGEVRQVPFARGARGADPAR